MRRRHRLLVAAGLLAPACSPAPVAYRGRADHSATPPADDAGTGAVPTSSTVPAVPEPDPTTTTVTVVLPHATTTTTLVLPERRDEAAGDVEWLVRQTFPEDPNRAAAIAWRESKFQPGADTNPPYIGVMQIDSVLHRKLIASMGYTTADLYNAVPNLAVARRLFDVAGWTPWA